MEKFSDSAELMLDAMIAGSSKIAIITHTHPDGDAIGSCVALKAFLDSRYDASSSIVLSNRENDSVSFLFDIPSGRCYAEEDNAAASTILEEAGLIFCLDFNTPSRTGTIEPMLAKSKAQKVLFDHHPDPDVESFGTIISSTRVSSTCEILYKSLKAMPGIDGNASRLPSSCLTAIMTGITTDTNNFANSVFPDTLSIVSELLALGVDRDAVLMHIYNEHRENRFRLMGRLLADEMKITSNGVAYMILSDALAKQYDIREGEMEGLVNIPLGIKSVRISIFVRGDDGFLRVSLRSKRGTSANAIARRYFNGGGHELASGGKLFYPKDIADKSDAASYIERVTEEYFNA